MNRTEYYRDICTDMRQEGSCQLAADILAAQDEVAAATASWETEKRRADALEHRNGLLEAVILRLAEAFKVEPPEGATLPDYIEQQIALGEQALAEERGN